VSPPTDRSRRTGETDDFAEMTTPAVESIVTLTPDFLAWHAALYFDFGAECMATQILGLNEEVRELGRRVWRSPTYAQLEAQRVITHEPCRVRSCRGGCSRCIHAAAWRKRGGRPYLGVQREAELAAVS
jgi:hypothetical protein